MAIPNSNIKGAAPGVLRVSLQNNDTPQSLGIIFYLYDKTNSIRICQMYKNTSRVQCVCHARHGNDCLSQKWQIDLHKITHVINTKVCS